MDILSDWIGPATERYGTSIVVITGIDWQDALSPWPAKGVPRGCPDFKGLAPEFLSRLQDKVIPQIEASMGFTARPGRTLVGVSMSGLFALWQWMQCDTFDNIASLSGSFWYDGFVESLKKQSIPHKNGHAYFLLGDREARSKVKAFDTVAADTQAIIALLDADGINTRFESVPGNHYADPIGRLDKAFAALGEMS
ncbi:MAG: alpha/beta hydrolase-fold protein [Bacteroidales bacterium]|nr:alpha/beta hydrolase-fold protein [Bacteroidales bacterium]